MNYLSQSWLINRRHALRAMGTCIALPMLECMTPLKAAEKVSTPRRSAFIYLANGVHSLNYQITESGHDYKFSRSLKPLEKHRDAITPISGLHHPGSLGHHHNCINVFLTGGKIGAAHRNSISVDQKMAEITGQHTRYSSLEVALTHGSLPFPATPQDRVEKGRPIRVHQYEKGRRRTRVRRAAFDLAPGLVS